MNRLPRGWEWSELAEVTRPKAGRIKPSDDDDQPYLSLEDLESGSTRILRWRRAGDYRSSSAQIAPGDVLYGRLRPYLNKVTVADRAGLASSEFIVFPSSPALSSRWLMYLLSSEAFVSFADTICDGDRPRVKWAQMSRFRFGLPPLREQERIVAAIEERLSRLDAAEAAIRSSRPKLDILRKSAISKVLERRAWPIVRWGDVGEVLSGRTFPSAAYGDKGIRLLRPGNLGKAGRVTWTSKATTCLPENFAAESPKYLLSGRNLLMNLTAQSLADDFLGRVCLSDDGDQFLLNQRIAKLSSSSASDEYLFWVFRSGSFRRYVAGLNTGSLIQHISTNQLASFAFPLPPTDEQIRLVDEIKVAVDAVDRAELFLDQLPSRSSRLRRSIVAAAFSGLLVPQDPTDEPASASLESTHADREVVVPTKRRRKVISS